MMENQRLTKEEERDSGHETGKVRAPEHLYTREFFSSGNYDQVGLGRFSRFWFSRRYYAALLRRFAPANEPRTLLDAGCGLGYLLGLLQDDFQCTGVDRIAWAVEQSRRNAPLARVLEGDVNDLGSFESGTFSAVIGLGIVEHLERPRDFIREVYRVLQPEGVFIFATGNPEYTLRRFKDPTCDAIGIDPTHINVQLPSTWRAWSEAEGLVAERHFSDGLWDVPYLPLLPKALQAVVFGAPAAIQVLTRTTFIPLGWGVNQVLIARKPASE